MKIRSFTIALLASMLLAGAAVAADVTFAMQAPPGEQVVFSKVPLQGLPKPGPAVETMKEINGVAYYTWKTSINSTAVVCGVVASNPTATSKCIGTPGAQLRLDGNFVVLN